MVPLLLSSLCMPLRGYIKLLARVRNPLRRGVVQVHETLAACARTNIPSWGGIVDSVVDESVCRDMPEATL